jgi:hypothetical protein
MSTCFDASSTYGSFFLKKIKISIFDGISKFLKLIWAKFWQNLAIIGSFGHIMLQWQWVIACPHWNAIK